MKLRDLKIGTQLRIGLGAILLFLLILGALGWFQVDSMWQETMGLYKHPLVVQRAIGEIKADILAVRTGLKDLLLADNDQDRESLIYEIETSEAYAMREFDILNNSYLGPRGDIVDAHNAFVQLKSICDETVRLLRAGKVAEAANRTKPAGVGGAKVETLLGLVQKIGDFARDRSEKFFQDAKKQKDALTVQLGVAFSAIFLLSLGIFYLLLQGIRGPLKELTSVAGQFRLGKLEARSRYSSANELGTLAATFNDLAQTVQMELQSKENVSRIADVMLREEDLRFFCQELLRALLQQTGSQIGAVYLLNEQKTDFEHFESIGLPGDGRPSFSAAGREGEFGAVLLTGQIQHITDIPADIRTTFSTVSGDFIPREIMTLPILSEQEVVAVISLACLRSYPAPAVRLVNEVWSVLAARLNAVLRLRKILDFSEKLEHQNRELDAQKRELTIQKNELNEQNIELEMQKKQLDDANRLKSAFLANMSHELRTPLNSVIALSAVLNRRLADTIPEEERSYLEVIERNGRNLLALINDILDLSRIEAGREEIRLSHFSIRELVAEVVAMIEPQAREKGIVLLNHVTGDLPPLHSDFSKCLHILQNLVGNAVKFTGAGKVEISIAQEDDSIEIAVTDTGIGIAANQLRDIFDEFHQADQSTTRNYGGTGLGLSIARKYATLLGGNITVDSTLGKGSTFTLKLPLTIDAPSMDKDAAQTKEYDTSVASFESSSSRDAQGKRILLVEDSEPAIVQMLDILSGQGYSMQVARNGREALEQIEKIAPDAVILDLMMPEVDGFEVLREIRGSGKTAHIPVLILTAKYVTREELNFLEGNHVHQLIQKGDINKTDLLAAISKMVAPSSGREALPPPAPARIRTSGKPVILVVEDNPDNLRTLKALLQDTCTVIEAADGRAAVEQARTHTPDLILMDLAMPVMDGFQALYAIRKQDALRHIPVIALTASAMQGDREKILGHGFDGYISKPVDKESLEVTIKEKLYGSQ